MKVRTLFPMYRLVSKQIEFDAGDIIEVEPHGPDEYLIPARQSKRQRGNAVITRDGFEIIKEDI